MNDDGDMTDWLPGQPPPWLAAYGASPLDQGVQGGVLAPQQQSEILVAPPPDQALPVAAPPPPVAPTTHARPGRPKPGTMHFGEPAPATLEETPLSAPSQVPRSSEQPPWLQTLLAPHPDAISGGEPAQPRETPDQTNFRIATDPNAPVSERQLAWQDIPPEARANLVNTADPNKLAAIATSSMSPDDLATIAIRHQQAQIHLQSAQQLELARRADEEARANFQAHQAAVERANAATAQLSADAFRLSQQKIDPQEHGVGRFLASVLLAGIGGAASRATGGRNLALEELDKNTQQRIDAQKADIANQWQGLGFKRNLIGEELQRSGDLYRAQETYRISQYDRATSELQTMMQDYDPQGTTALKAAGALQQIQAQRQQSLIAFNQQQFKNDLEARKDQRETLLAMSTAQKNNAETAKLMGALGGGGGAGGTITPDQVRSMLPELPAELVPKTGISQKQLDQLAETTSKLTGASKGQLEYQSNLNASTVQNPVAGQPFTDAKGKPITMPVEQAKELNEAVVATQQTIDSLSAARRAIEADPSTFDRAEWTKIQSNINQALPTLAKVYGEKYSARTEEALKDVLSLDYDSYNKRVTDRKVGLASIDNTIETLKRNGETQLTRLKGYDKRQSPFLDTSKPAESTRSSAVAELVKGANARSTIEEHAYGPLMMTGPAVVSNAQAAGAALRISKVDQLLQMAQLAKGPERAAAIAGLQEIANSGVDDVVRRAAQSALGIIEQHPNGRSVAQPPGLAPLEQLGQRQSVLPRIVESNDDLQPAWLSPEPQEGPVE